MAGVPITQSLTHTGKSTKSISYQAAYARLEEAVLDGNPLSRSMKALPDLFPPIVIQLLTVGESTGTLPENAQMLGSIFESELADELAILTHILEPILMLGMGLIVGFVALAIISPMYALTQSISLQ